jgi:hypothetical protein
MYLDIGLRSTIRVGGGTTRANRAKYYNYIYTKYNGIENLVYEDQFLFSIK